MIETELTNTYRTFTGELSFLSLSGWLGLDLSCSLFSDIRVINDCDSGRGTDAALDFVMEDVLSSSMEMPCLHECTNRGRKVRSIENRK